MSRRDGVPWDRSQCSGTIKRLELGCKKPKLRARRNRLGGTCCRTSPQPVKFESVPAFWLRVAALDITLCPLAASAHLCVVGSVPPSALSGASAMSPASADYTARSSDPSRTRWAPPCPAPRH